jgi:hypothetical protein
LPKHQKTADFNSLQPAPCNSFNVIRLSATEFNSVQQDFESGSGQGSEVQILSPRPILFSDLASVSKAQSRATGLTQVL